jgi:hypothetical protein
MGKILGGSIIVANVLCAASCWHLPVEIPEGRPGLSESEVATITQSGFGKLDRVSSTRGGQYFSAEPGENSS